MPEFLLEKTLKQFFRYFVKGWCYNKDAFSEKEIQLYVDAYMKPGALTATINYYRAMMQVTIRNPINIPSRKISSDTLLIWGENDQALSKEMTYGMNPYFEGNLEIKYIPNCSHWVQNDAPEAVNEYLMAFLK